MSRIGKQPIKIPKEAEVKIGDSSIEIKGPKGSLNQEIVQGIKVEENNGNIIVIRNSDQKEVRSLHGLIRSLIANMIKGVTEGYQKNLSIEGVGYKAALEGKTLILNIGYSHPIRYSIPNGIDISIEKQTALTIKGISKQLVGQVAAEIRNYKKPDIYKGKGIRYTGEYIKLKEGKAGKTASK